MPVTFGSFITSMATNAIKNQVKKKGLEIIERTARVHLSGKMTKGTLSYFASDRELNMAIRGIKRGIRLPKNLKSLYKSRDLYRTYNKAQGVYSKVKYQVKDIEKVDKLRNFHEGSRLNNLEKKIFSFSQEQMSLMKKSPEGAFNIDDLMKNDDIREVARKYISLPDKNKDQEEFKLTKYDANYLFNQFNDTKEVTKEELKEKLVTRFNDSNEAEKEYDTLIKRLDKNIEAGYVSFDEESGKYKITNLGIEEAERIKKTFEFTSYDANVIFEYIRKNKGSVSLEELQLELMKKYDDTSDRQKQFKYLANRFENNRKAGYLEYENGRYYISDAGHGKLNEFRQIEDQKLKEYFESKFGYFSSMGLLNDRGEGVFQVTDKYLKMIELNEMKDYLKSLEPIEKLEDFKVNNFQKHVLKLTYDDKEEGLAIHKVLNEYRNDIRVEDPERKFQLFENACQRLTVQGYMELKDEKYYLTETGKEFVANNFKDKVFEFGFADVRIIKMIDAENGALSIDKIKELIPEEDKQRMLLGRLNKLEKEGLIAITEKGYILTDSCKDRYEEFFRNFRENMNLGDIDLKVFNAANVLAQDNVFNVSDLTKDEDLMKDVEKFLSYKKSDNKEESFMFGRYDANYLFSYFDKDTNAITIDELTSKLEKRYTDKDKGAKEFEVLTKRLEKNIEAGYIQFDKESSSYSITEIGLEKRKEFSSAFEFTSYDANVIFDYINKNDGNITLPKLQVELSKEFADVTERQNQFKYLEKRFNKNVEAGYLSVENGEYKITSLGLQTLEKHTEVRNKEAIEFLSKKLDYLSSLGFYNVVDEGKYQLTIDTLSALDRAKNRNEIITIGNVESLSKLDDFKLNNFHKHVLKTINENGGSLDIEKLLNDYRNDVKVPDPIRKLKTFQKSADRLVVQGYIEVKDNKYVLADKVNEVKGIGKGSSDFILGFADVRILRMIDQEQGVLPIDVIREKIEEDKQKMVLGRINKLEAEGIIKITDKGYVKSEIANDRLKVFLQDVKDKKEQDIKDNFKLSNFDKRIFKDAKNDIIDLSIKGNELNRRYGNKQEEITKQLNIYVGRCKKLEIAGYLAPSDNGFILTEKAKEMLKESKIEDIKGNFKFSNFDKRILNKIGDGVLSLEDEKNQLMKRYKNNAKEFNRQLNMITGRCDKLELMGYLEKTTEGFKVTDKAKNLLNSIIPDVDVKAIDSFVFGDFDIKNVFKYFDFNNELTLESFKSTLDAVYSKEISDRQYGIISSRIMKNVNAGYIVFDEAKNIFKIADKGLYEVRKAHDKTREILTLNKIKEITLNYTLSDKRFNTHIKAIHGPDSIHPGRTLFNKDFDIKKAIDEVLKDKNSVVNKNTSNRRGYVIEKTYPEAIGIDPKGKPIKNLRIVIDEKGNIITAFPSRNVINNADNKHDLRKYSLTKFDFELIAGVSQGGLWSKELFNTKCSDLEMQELELRLNSVMKRLETLEKAGLVKKENENVFRLDPIFLEREINWREKKTDKFSTEQKKIFNDLKQFLNLTDKQISNFIYNDNTIIANTDIRQLVNKGYLGEATRDLKGDGVFSKVYYLTTKGKKAASHVEGAEVERIYDSKLHNRPEELRHDVLVYSAFKHYESLLDAEGCKVTKIMTDKQLRAELNRDSSVKNSGKFNSIRHEKIELPDLYIEFEEVKTGEKGFINLEVDCDYKPHVIKSKADNIENLVWFTDSQKQMQTIQRTLGNANVFVLPF